MNEPEIEVIDSAMNKRIKFRVLVGLGLLALLFYYLNYTSPESHFVAAYRTPIEFYGKVVDQQGDPVPGAKVAVRPWENPFGESKTVLTLASDTNGRVSVENLEGMPMGVEVTKEGYLTKSDLGLDKLASARRIEFGLDGTGGARFKDPANPTLFNLHKLGVIEPLVYVNERRWKLPADGTPRKIALDSEAGIGNHQIEFRFDTERARVPSDIQAPFGPFSWKLKLRISGGGFVKSESDFVFEAPAVGYHESILIDHPKDEKQWVEFDFGRYFVLFPDGTHGRIRFSIDGRSAANPLMMTSWFNPKSGSRNLASDKHDASLRVGE